MGRRTSKEKPREIKCNRCQEVFEDSHKRDRRRRVCVKIIPNKKLMRLQARIRLAEDANAQFIEKAERRAAAAERARQSPDNVPEQLVEKSDEETGEKHFRISIVVIGHVDSGKSTTTGHLIYTLGGIDPCVLERYEKEAADMNKQSYKYSWILDKLKAERERGISIDISLLRFQTTNYRCTVIDKPGHRDFLKNMITGASQADCAMLVIDATAGAFEASMLKDGQTREHATLASVLGVKQIICCCNKTKAKPVEMHGQVLSEAVAGDMIGFSSKHLYTNEVKVKRGDVVSNTKDHPAKGATRFTSQIILLDYLGKIKEGYTPLLHCHTSRTPVRFSELTSKIDKQTHEPIESKQEYLTGKDSALVKMQAIKPLVVEPFDEYPPLGRFAVRDSRQTVAVGVIKTVDKVTEGEKED